MRVHPLDIAGRAIVAIVAAVALFAIAVPSAFAWDVAKSTNGVVIIREASDTTTTCEIRHYWDYKGSAYSPASSASYNASQSISNAIYASTDVFEVELKEGFRRQFVLVGNGSTFRGSTVIYEPLMVTVENTVAVSGLPTASMTGTVSVEGTQTVELVSFGESIKHFWMLGLLALGVVVGSVILPWK